ncbi:hypothetical protein PsorP6_017909 [Peronosclerospora sorghi]|uniref:Uncharacterized protein n=1 Tax=Peronosclerospora sorghi TaxID=230839 RepID=A0ACC0WDE7_9STRA|nr:hypothetical protein PsorP6_017909 [Peronosclerospora sorghi]
MTTLVAAIHPIRHFVVLKKLSNFGNGHDAVWMWKQLFQCRAQRVVKEPEEERTITENDAEKAGEIVVVARKDVGYFGLFFPLQHSADLLIFNNIQADIIKEEGGINYIFAVDVASGSRTQFYEYGCALSVW